MKNAEVSVWERAVLAAFAQLENRRALCVLGGSAGLALRGITLPSPPRDIDLYADAADGGAAHEALAQAGAIVDEPFYSETDIYRSRLSHYRVDGIPVELVVGFEVETTGGAYRTEVRKVLLPYADWTELGGRRLPLVPLAHELWFNALRGREDRVEAIAGAMAARPALHAPAMAAIEARNRLHPELRTALRRRIGADNGEDRP